VIRTLLDEGLLHGDILTVWNGGMEAYASEPALEGDALAWSPVTESRDDAMLRRASAPFQPDGGMRLVQGNLGRATFKTSAVDSSRWTIEAPARVFQDQDDVLAAYKKGELHKDVVVVVRFQGPRANGMPELHKLTPALGSLQDKGFKVALVTDGRMSGASGKVPAAIHLSPEALGGGLIGKVRDGDVIRLSADDGTLNALVDPAEWEARELAITPRPHIGTGRELFAFMRHGANAAEQGGSALLAAMCDDLGEGMVGDGISLDKNIEDEEIDA